MRAVYLIVEDDWLTVEPHKCSVSVVIKTQYGHVVRKANGNHHPLLHPLVRGTKYRVEIYGKVRVFVSTRYEWLHFKIDKRGKVFLCEFSYS